uniref:Uncharacterized protein n=1 Tax=Ochrobactrum phage ORM_20 TaxID=2985243 RepID=A0A9N6ZHP5_9VIRU|nr:hypothetical protein ORM20_00130 [Ochrobactrum phage ORM_20]
MLKARFAVCRGDGQHLGYTTKISENIRGILDGMNSVLTGTDSSGMDFYARLVPIEGFKYPNSTIDVLPNGKIRLRTLDISYNPSGEAEYDSVDEFLDRNRFGDKKRAYFNGAFDEQEDLRRYKTWINTKRGIGFLENMMGNPITFNKGKGGELSSFADFGLLVPGRRYDIRKTENGVYSFFLKDYITIENENKRYAEPILTVK